MSHCRCRAPVNAGNGKHWKVGCDKFNVNAISLSQCRAPVNAPLTVLTSKRFFMTSPMPRDVTFLVTFDRDSQRWWRRLLQQWANASDRDVDVGGLVNAHVHHRCDRQKSKTESLIVPNTPCDWRKKTRCHHNRQWCLNLLIDVSNGNRINCRVISVFLKVKLLNIVISS